MAMERIIKVCLFSTKVFLPTSILTLPEFMTRGIGFEWET